METGNHAGLITAILSGLLLLTCNTAILFAAIEEAPVLDKIESADLLYTKGVGRVVITSTLSIADKDSWNLNSATIRITSGFNASEDVLRFSRQNGISGSWNKATGILSLTGRSSIAYYQKALRSVQYENINTINPSTATRVVSFTVNDGHENSNTVSRNIVINIPNTAPVLTNIETAPVVYCTGSGAAIITSAINVFDPDNADLTAATIQITAGYNSNQDFLIFTDQNGITASWDSSSGVLSLSGVSLTANYQAALRSIRYGNTNSVDPYIGNRVISLAVYDEKSMSNSLTRSIGVNGRVSAVLTGSASICNDDIATVPLSIVFSGTPPWEFTLTRDNENDTIYANIKLDSLTINVKQEGTYRIEKISDASCTGDTTGSGYAKIIYNTPPTAILSGVSTICQGDTAELQVVLTGTGPWSITYSVDGSNQTTVNDILSTHFSLRVTVSGTYTLTRVEDALCKGKASGTGLVSEFMRPTAIISGDATICQYTSGNLNVALTGNAPWKFAYRRNAENPIEIPNVIINPRDIPVQRAGTYTLYEVFDKNCKGTIFGSAVITITQAPYVALSGLKPAYNVDSLEIVPMSGTPAGGIFSGNGVFGSVFIPRMALVGTHNIIYAYQSPSTLCYGYDTVVVRVLETYADLDYENDRTKYCINDSPFKITGTNIALDTGSFSISGNVGLTDHHNNTATIDPALLNMGEYTITYNYEMMGTIFPWTSKFEIGTKPIADFSWATECFQSGQPIAFKENALSSFGYLNDTLFFWKIYTNTGYSADTARNITHTFPEPGNHRIELQIKNTYGCSDTVTRMFSLRPTKPLDGITYFEDFETKPIGWQSDSLPPAMTNSWKLGTPSKHDVPARGFSDAHLSNNCWYTYIPTNTAPLEQSTVTSPCFDFTGTERPMLKVWIWRSFTDIRDGANLQASSDSGKSWTAIGLLNDGINWFNEYQITAKPGDEAIGWSNIKDAGWIESRHSLDFLKGRSQVQFRIAYGATGSALRNDGIAFDDFSIIERNRTALIEHFTNISDIASAAADSALDEFILNYGSTIIDLQYHTADPPNDPFYEDNPVIPTARQFYYGLSGVPYAVLDGGLKSQHRFDYTEPRPLNKNAAIIESLLDSKFQINLTSEIRDNTLTVVAQLSALQSIPLTEISVRIAVIERVIGGITGVNGDTSFRSVVKTMLPGAAGTTIYKAWNPGDYRDIEQSWELQHVYNPGELRVVAFIQNEESTYEIYQATLDTIALPTGINDPLPRSLVEKSFIVYPNPAERLVNVRFSQETLSGVIINLYNNLGRLVYSTRIPAGTDKTEIPVENFPDGLYLLRLMSNDKLIGNSKLTISK